MFHRNCQSLILPEGADAACFLRVVVASMEAECRDSLSECECAKVPGRSDASMGGTEYSFDVGSSSVFRLKHVESSVHVFCKFRRRTPVVIDRVS